MNKVLFFIHDRVHLLDLAGAVQVFYESGNYGVPYDIHFVSDRPDQHCSSNLRVFALEHFSSVQTGPSDIVFVPGYNTQVAVTEGLDPVYTWLRTAQQDGALICSICTGAFFLAAAGLLDGRECTTHWMYTDKLQQAYPLATVLRDKLFVRSGNVYSSAGVTTGIDLALYLLEQRHGAPHSYRVARDLVVYMRRDGNESQESVYLQHRQHISYPIHEVQDWIIHHLGERISLEQLAALAHTGPRNLTRLFKAKTGITVGEYIEKLRVEKAVQLLRDKQKIDGVARDCGFQSTNQLRTLLKRHKGMLPNTLRALV